MAQARSFFDDVKKEIECPVCQEQFGANKQPKILKCLHTFCKSCLEGWLRQHRTGALSCPTCRTVTECPNNDIDSFPSNLFYKQMVEIVEAYTGQEESSCCGKCDEQKSLKFYCSNCNCLLCEECAALHKKWKDFRGHQLKEIGQLQSSDVEDYSRRTNVCKEHDDEFRFFCESCQICICRDCAILDHDDHRKTSLEKGLEHKTTEIEDKIREVQANRSLLGNKKESLEKRRIKVMNSFERATNGVRAVAEQWITYIRKHEADITEKLMKQKDAFEAEFSNLMSSLDGRVVEIESSLDFGEEILSRRNLPEILNVKEMLENRLQELSVPFEPTLVFPEVVYSSNDPSCLKDGPGKLIRTVTEPTVSVAEGRGLNEAIEGEENTFTVITNDIKGQIVYSEVDQVNVEIISINTMGTLTASVSDTKNGRYQVRYRSEAADDFKISVTVRGEAIKDSPFRLQVRKREIQTFHQFHRAEITSMKTGIRAEPKISKMTSKGYTIDVVDPFASRAQEVGAWCRDGTDEDDENFEGDDQLEHMLGPVKLSVIKGDITDQNVDVIVNAANSRLRHGAGVAGAIIVKGGYGIQKESDNYISRYGPLNEGEVAVTGPGKLPYKRIIHAIVPTWKRSDAEKCKRTLKTACLKSLAAAASNKKCTSIAFPAISSVLFGMPKEISAKVMFEAVKEYITRGDPSKAILTDIRFVIIDDPTVKVFKKEFIEFFQIQKDQSLTADPTASKLPRLKRRRKKGKNGANDVNYPLTSQGDSSSKSFSDAITDPDSGGASKDDECVICLGGIENVKKLNCGHVFCTDCAETALNYDNRCPVCKEPQGVVKGNQPNGQMHVNHSLQSLPGYRGCRTIIITYSFPNGIQGREHQHPGEVYNGTSRTAYLPDNREGKEVLALLRRAFDARLVFTVGTSVTTGWRNQITWNGIHHKTNMSGGPQAYGYPDPDYLRRVKEDLAAKGIR